MSVCPDLDHPADEGAACGDHDVADADPVAGALDRG